MDNKQHIDLGHLGLIAAFAAVILLAAWVERGTHSQTAVIKPPAQITQNPSSIPSKPSPTGQVAGAAVPINARGEVPNKLIIR